MSGKDERHKEEREEEKKRVRERESAFVCCSICPIVSIAAELFIQSPWYRLKHAATSCQGIERGPAKERLWKCVCFSFAIKKSLKKYRQEKNEEKYGGEKRFIQTVMTNQVFK